MIAGSSNYTSTPAASLSREDLAADWLARRERGLSVEEQAEFSQWLLADEQNAQVVKELESAWRRMRQPRLNGQADAVTAVLAQKLQARRQRRRWLTGMVASGIAAALLLVVLPSRKPAELNEVSGLPASVVLKPERRNLSDGSVVELAAGAEIVTDFTPELRAVRLVRGEAHFIVAKNAARPFVVTAGKVTVRAVGTAFAVRFAPEEVGVLVTEGRVAVRQHPDSPQPHAESLSGEPVFVDAGGQVVMSATQGALPAASSVNDREMAAALAWRTARVEFTDTRLQDAVELFNRQNAIKLEVSASTLGDVRISGIFWTNDVEGFARLVASSVGATLEQPAADRLVLKP